MAGGLAASRWAPSPQELAKREAQNTTTTTTTTTTATLTPSSPTRPGTSPSRPAAATKPPTRELNRFTKIISRLKWKLPFLAQAYRLATTFPRVPSPNLNPMDNDNDINDINDINDTNDTNDTTSAHAEIMFKIDFYEYYALLERAIVHLLGVFGIAVSAAFAQSQLTLSPSPRSYYNYNHNSGPGGYSHRYHANVLEALEDEMCPIHCALGEGVVIEQLRRVKELRNRWKSADMSREGEGEGEEGGNGYGNGRGRWRRSRSRSVELAAMPLESYDFDNILADIFRGLEVGYAIAREYVGRVDGMGMGGYGQNGNGNGGGSGEEGWGFMVDAMDWEAV